MTVCVLQHTVNARAAPEARTLDLASILTKRVSALETAGLGCRGVVVGCGGEVGGVLLATASLM